jgi:hypothetical protein
MNAREYPILAHMYIYYTYPELTFAFGYPHLLHLHQEDFSRDEHYS